MGGLLSMVIGKIVAVITGLTILAAVVYFINHGGGAGSAAVHQLFAYATGFFTALIGGIAHLVQECGRAFLRAVQ